MTTTPTTKGGGFSDNRLRLYYSMVFDGAYNLMRADHPTPRQTSRQDIGRHRGTLTNMPKEGRCPTVLNALGLMGPSRTKDDLSNRVLPTRPDPVTPTLRFCVHRYPRYFIYRPPFHQLVGRVGRFLFWGGIYEVCRLRGGDEEGRGVGNRVDICLYSVR